MKKNNIIFLDDVREGRSQQRAKIIRVKTVQSENHILNKKRI